MKKLIRRFLLWCLNLVSQEIRDCRSGEKLGRGLLLAWAGKVQVIGYNGRPLIPVFLPQQRLTFWRQVIGFTSHPDPDFPGRSEDGTARSSMGDKVLNLIITHKGGEQAERLLRIWRECSSGENVWLIFGGSRQDFETIDYPKKLFIDDPGLRTQDHQREKQSYAGILKACVPVIERESPDFVYLCEYDHLPAVSDLNERQIRALREDGADVMAHSLIRTDRTCWPIALSHESEPSFHPFWESVSLRDDPDVVLWMFGSGSFWTREAFMAVASRPQEIPCYFEVYLPTLAHHLGFRVRNWKGSDHLIHNLPAPGFTLEAARRQGCWTVHPVKELDERMSPGF
jgi:hypothetical protein